jgi:hypothetical protein
MHVELIPAPGTPEYLPAAHATQSETDPAPTVSE